MIRWGIGFVEQLFAVWFWLSDTDIGSVDGTADTSLSLSPMICLASVMYRNTNILLARKNILTNYHKNDYKQQNFHAKFLLIFDTTYISFRNFRKCFYILFWKFSWKPKIKSKIILFFFGRFQNDSVHIARTTMARNRSDFGYISSYSCIS